MRHIVSFIALPQALERDAGGGQLPVSASWMATCSSTSGASGVSARARVERDGTFAPPLCSALGCDTGAVETRRMQQRPGDGERRVERDRTLEVLDRARGGVGSPLEIQRSSLQILLVRGHVARHTRRAAQIADAECDLQRIGDGARDVVLNGEDVRERALVGLRPELTVRLHLAQSNGDAHSIAPCAHAAFEHVIDAERRADRA